MDQISFDSPLLASTSNLKKPVLDERVFLPPSPSSPLSETDGYLAPDDSDSDDDSGNIQPTKRCGIRTSVVMLTRVLLFGLTLANIITWSAIGGRISRNRFVVLTFIELVFMLITNGGFIFKLVRENSRDRGLSIKIPRISLAVGDWSCSFGVGKKWLGGDDDKDAKRVRDLLKKSFGVFIELYLGITLIVFTKCAFHTASWWEVDFWRAPLVIGYVVGSFQLLAVILNQITPLGRRTTIEIAYHSDRPARKGRHIQLPIDTETANAPVSIAA